MQGDLGVRGAGVRVGHAAGRRGRVGRVVQRPAGYPGLVDPRGEQRAPVRRPPVPAEAVELLGRDELRQPPADALLAGDEAVRIRDPECTPRDVADPGTGRVRPGVDDRPGRGYLDDPVLDKIGPEQPAGQREGGHGRGRVGRVRADPRRRQPLPLAQRALLGRQIPGVGEQRGRVGDQPLGTAGHVEDIQPVGRVLGAAGAQEHHAGAVGGHAEGAGCPAREPTGTRSEFRILHPLMMPPRCDARGRRGEPA